MRYTALCDDVRMGTVELQLPNAWRCRAASVQRISRLLGDCPAPEWTPGGQPVRRE
jgi:hypothetical protein